MSSLCIHGFVSAETPLAFEANDIAGGLRLCAEGGIAAIVAAAPECGFHQLPREQAASLLLRHQQVLEAAMAQTTVLPAKFGTSAPDEQAVRRMLIQGNPLLGTQLADFAGRLQMEIVVLWPLDKIFAEIAADPKIADLRTRAQASSDAAMKTQLGEAVKAALDQRRASLSEEICSVLRGAAIDMAVNPIMDDRIVANVALLINKGDLCHLETVLERLDAENDGRLIFRCIGPLPPANFATVAIEFPPREAIDRARRILELGPQASQGDIKSAYHRLARAHHPDSAGHDGQDARMSELSQAYRFLMTCAKARTSEAKDGTSLFDADAADGIVLIEIVRQDLRTAAGSGAARECAA